MGEANGLSHVPAPEGAGTPDALHRGVRSFNGSVSKNNADQSAATLICDPFQGFL